LIEAKDILTIGFLVLLEGILSADNAIVLAVLVLPLAKELRGKALRYGIWGAFIFRAVALTLVSHLMQSNWVRLMGGLYLLYLPFRHFKEKHRAKHSTNAVSKPRRAIWKLSPFWSTVLTIELTDIVFSIDSILVAVAISNKLWVVITGGILGIIAMRFVAGGFLRIIEHFPAVVDGAYVIVTWIGIKLTIEFLHRLKPPLAPFEIPENLYFAVIGVILLISLLWRTKPMAPEEEAVEETVDLFEQSLVSDNEASTKPK